MALYQAQLSRYGGAAFNRAKSCNVLLPQMTKMTDHSRENELVATPHPGQHLTVLDVMSYSKQIGNSLDPY